MEYLPLEIFVKIILNLEIKNIISLDMVSKSLHKLVEMSWKFYHPKIKKIQLITRLDWKTATRLFYNLLIGAVKFKDHKIELRTKGLLIDDRLCKVPLNRILILDKLEQEMKKNYSDKAINLYLNSNIMVLVSETAVYSYLLYENTSTFNTEVNGNPSFPRLYLQGKLLELQNEKVINVFIFASVNFIVTDKNVYLFKDYFFKRNVIKLLEKGNLSVVYNKDTLSMNFIDDFYSPVTKKIITSYTVSDLEKMC